MTPEAPHKHQNIPVQFSPDGVPMALRYENKIWMVDSDVHTQAYAEHMAVTTAGDFSTALRTNASLQHNQNVATLERPSSPLPVCPG